MGVGLGTGGEKKGFASKTARGIAIGVLTASMAASMAACSTGGGGTGPSNVTLAQALADYYAGNTTLAKSEFKTVVKNDPNDKYGWYNLGVIEQSAGNTSVAATDYNKSIAIDPGFESALYNLGVLRFQQNNMTDAIKWLGKAVVANAKDANAHWNLGLALARTNTKPNNLRATKELNAGLKLDPGLLQTLGVPKKKPAPAIGGTGPKATASTTTSTAS